MFLKKVSHAECTMHLKEFTYQRQKCKHGPVPIKTRPRTEGVVCRNHPVCFASLPQYCCIQQAGNGFVSPHCVCSVYQKQITVFFLPLSVFSFLFSFFLKACMHVIVQSTFIDQTDASAGLVFLFHQGTMLLRHFTRRFTIPYE